jgi:hypothetical protein
VRQTQTAWPADHARTQEGHRPMFELPQLYATEALVRDRIQDLNDTAAQVRMARRRTPSHAGPVMRVRTAIGRELISIGCAVVGQEA